MFQYIHVTINHYTSSNVTEIILFQYIHVTINQLEMVEICMQLDSFNTSMLLLIVIRSPE